MKRFFPIILMLMLILTLAIAGCGGGNSGNPGGGTLTGYVSFFIATPTTQDINAKHVKIEIISTNDTFDEYTYTDDSGNYSISNIPAGTYIVKADFNSVTNSPPASYTVANGGAFCIDNNPSWTSAWGWSIGGTYNNAVIGTSPTNNISISNGINTNLKFRLQVDA